MDQCFCDWCGRPAVTRSFRTLNANTEFEQTSSYQECEECNRLPTDEVADKYTILCTFPDDDADYCKLFVVETEWLLTQLEGQTLESFLDNYCWDETYFIYLQAVINKKVISESIEH